jgi:hypothetical protein
MRCIAYLPLSGLQNQAALSLHLQLAIVIQVDVLSLGLHGNRAVGVIRRR